MTAKPHHHITAAEYLALEDASDDRHEYAAGQIVALAGGSEAHVTICSNINALLHPQLRRRPCRLFTSDMKIRAEQPPKYLYPDVAVVCGPATYEDDGRRTLLNPTVIFEVLSDSTERRDRGVKFQWYRSIESLQEYILVAQSAMRIDLFRRQSGDIWLFASLDQPEQRLELSSIACELTLADIYEKVALDGEGAPEAPGR